MIRVKKTLALFLTEISAGVVYHNEIQNFVTEHKMITLLSALNFATLGAALKYSFGNGYGVREGGLLGAGALVVVGPAKDFLNTEKKTTYVNDLEEHVSDITPLENMEKHKAIYLIGLMYFYGDSSRVGYLWSNRGNCSSRNVVRDLFINSFINL